MRTLASLSVLLLATTAAAQPPVVNPARFAALNVGNRWEYTVADTLDGTARPLTYSVATVDGETDIGGNRYVVVTYQTFDAASAATSPRYTCAYSPTLGPAPAGATTLPDYDCNRQVALPPTLPFAPTTITPGATVEIGAQSVPVDSLLSFGNQSSGSGGQYSAYVYRYATGIGFVSLRSWGAGHVTAQGQSTFKNRTALSFARIGGVAYGASVVASETELSAAAFRLLTAPNPSAGPVRIATTGATGRVTVDVFDALGRRVDGGTVQGDAAFTFRASAAGIYVVRVTDEAGHVATQRVVRR